MAQKPDSGFRPARRGAPHRHCHSIDRQQPQHVPDRNPRLRRLDAADGLHVHAEPRRCGGLAFAGGDPSLPSGGGHVLDCLESGFADVCRDAFALRHARIVVGSRCRGHGGQSVFIPQGILLARSAPWHDKVIALLRAGNPAAAIAQIKVAPSVRELRSLEKALVEAQLVGRWKDVDLAVTEAVQSLSAPRLHRSP